MKNLALITIIMPVYNGAEYISIAINSVVSQSYVNWKLIIVNDGSTDLTATIVQKFIDDDSRISLVNNMGLKGAAGARNYGMSLSDGDFVAFIDSDDVWHPDKLKSQIELLQKEDSDFSYTSYEIIDSNGLNCKQTYIVPERLTLDQMLKQNLIGCSTVVISKEIASNYSFSSDFYHEDYCLWLRLLNDGHKAVGCTQPLVKWRLIAGSRSFNKFNSAISRWKIYRKQIGMSFAKSLKYFIFYVFNGICKYSK